MKRYKFLRNGFKSNSSNETWKIGEWKKFEGELSVCNAGFHCSKKPYQAFSYVQGEILAEVEVGGKSIIQDDKECWEQMRLVKAWKWQKKDSVALAIYCAELVLPNFEKKYPNDLRPRQAIEAAKKVLFEDSKENRSAAESAARSAADSVDSAESVGSAWLAAESAESVAWLAAESVESVGSAWLATESVARSAADSVDSAESSIKAWLATIQKISKWMKNHLKELEEI